MDVETLRSIFSLALAQSEAALEDSEEAGEGFEYWSQDDHNRVVAMLVRLDEKAEEVVGLL